jgi:hypothetical protein
MYSIHVKNFAHVPINAGCGRLHVDEFVRPQVREHRFKLGVCGGDHLPNQAERRFSSDHRERLEELLLLHRLSIDALGEYSLHGRWQSQLRERANHFHCAIAYQRTLVEQRLYELLDKEWITPGTLDHETLERLKLDPLAEQCRYHRRAIRVAQRVQPDPRIVSLGVPLI